MTELEILAEDLAEPAAYDEEAFVQRVMGQLDKPRKLARNGTTRSIRRLRLLVAGGLAGLEGNRNAGQECRYSRAYRQGPSTSTEQRRPGSSQ